MSEFHPAFVSRVKNDAFLDDQLLEALNTVHPTSIRIHPRKEKPELEDAIEISWCQNAYHLKERPIFTLDPLFHAGCLYPQEAGSMLLDTVIRQLQLTEQPICLDMCAAPGGKSTLLASFLDGKGLLVSNEVINQRARILKENITKWGYANCIVTNNDPSDFGRLAGLFDLIVIDAPCSGEGMFRKDKNARDEWSPENVQLCSGRQKRIINDCWASLKENGYLIYSTCTFNEDENELNLQWMLDNYDCEYISLEMPSNIQQGRNELGYYGIPGIAPTEGFFIGVIRKKSAENPLKSKKKKDTNFSRFKTDDKDFLSFVNPSSISMYTWKDLILGISSSIYTEAELVQQHLHIIKFGVELGSITRKGFQPSHDLAIAIGLLNEKVPSIELNRKQALHYLHGDTFPLEGKKGISLVRYQSQALGWIKHLGNRFNNNYPKEWRIRMDITK